MRQYRQYILVVENSPGRQSSFGVMAVSAEMAMRQTRRSWTGTQGMRIVSVKGTEYVR